MNFIANIGWSIPILAIGAFGSNSDFTWFLLGGMCITLLNTIVLPVQFGRTLGNFTTRTALYDTQETTYRNLSSIEGYVSTLHCSGSFRYTDGYQLL